jgi:hypothetical protein
MPPFWRSRALQTFGDINNFLLLDRWAFRILDGHFSRKLSSQCHHQKKKKVNQHFQGKTFNIICCSTSPIRIPFNMLNSLNNTNSTHHKDNFPALSCKMKIIFWCSFYCNFTIFLIHPKSRKSEKEKIRHKNWEEIVIKKNYGFS